MGGCRDGKGGIASLLKLLLEGRPALTRLGQVHFVKDHDLRAARELAIIALQFAVNGLKIVPEIVFGGSIKEMDEQACPLNMAQEFETQACPLRRPFY